MLLYVPKSRLPSGRFSHVKIGQCFILLPHGGSETAFLNGESFPTEVRHESDLPLLFMIDTLVTLVVFDACSTCYFLFPTLERYFLRVQQKSGCRLQGERKAVLIHLGSRVNLINCAFNHPCTAIGSGLVCLRFWLHRCRHLQQRIFLEHLAKCALDAVRPVRFDPRGSAWNELGQDRAHRCDPLWDPVEVSASGLNSGLQRRASCRQLRSEVPLMDIIWYNMI